MDRFWNKCASNKSSMRRAHVWSFTKCWNYTEAVRILRRYSTTFQAVPVGPRKMYTPNVFLTVEIRKLGGLRVEELTTGISSHLRAQKKPVCRQRVALVFLLLAPKVSAPSRQLHLFDSRQIVRIVSFCEKHGRINRFQTVDIYRVSYQTNLLPPKMPRVASFKEWPMIWRSTPARRSSCHAFSSLLAEWRGECVVPLMVPCPNSIPKATCAIQFPFLSCWIWWRMKDWLAMERYVGICHLIATMRGSLQHTMVLQQIPTLAYFAAAGAGSKNAYQIL